MMNNLLLGTWRVLSMRLLTPFTLPNANGQQQQSVAASNLSTTHPIRSRPVNSFWSLSIIVISLLGASPVSAEDFEGLSYTLDTPTSGEATLTDLADGSINVIDNIPGRVIFNSKSYTVTSIGDRAFKDKNLTSVTIPEGIINIGTEAFSNNKLTSLDIPSSATNIKGFAFSNNTLDSVTLPSNATRIWEGVFFDNRTLTSIIIPDSVLTIERSAFKNTGLTSVTIPNNVTTIEESAFSNSALISLIIGNSVTSIGVNAFSVTSLTSLIIPDSVINIDDYAFSIISELTSLTLGESVQSIGEYAFSQNGLVGELMIPNSVNTIKEGAFEKNKLSSVQIGSGLTRLNFAVFNENELTAVKFLGDYPTASGTFFDRRAFDRNTSLNLIQACKNKTGWDDIRFATGSQDITVSSIDCSYSQNGLSYYLDDPTNGEATAAGLASDSDERDIDIPDEVRKSGVTYTVTRIEGFSNKSLNSVLIGENVTAIEAYAFGGNQLTSVIIPDSVTRIETVAFSDNKITKVTFLGGYYSDFDADAFAGNTDLATIEACIGSEGWEGKSFNIDNTSLTITLVSCDISVDGLAYEVVEAQNAFEYYEQNLASAIQDCVGCHSSSEGTLGALESNANQTNYTAFSEYITAGNGERLLSKVRGVSHSGGEQFALGSNEYIALSEFLELETNNTASATVLGRSSDSENTVIDIPDNVTLNGVTYPVTSVAPNAFKNAPITAVTIGSNVTSIGFVAFCGSPELTSVTIPGQMVSIGSNAFCGIESVKFMGDYSTGFTPDAFEYDFKLTPSFTVEACFDSPSWDGVSFQAGRENVMVTLCADVYISRISNAAESGDTSKLTIEDLTALVDLKNIEPDNIDAYLAAISAGDGEDLDTLTEIQTLVNEVNNKDNSNDITDSNDSAPGLPLWLFKVAKDAEAARVNP
jgi:hypothetical protein